MGSWATWVHQPQTFWLRRAIFQIHLWAGLAAGLYITVIGVSGSVLVYRNELYAAFSPQPGGPLPAGFRFTTWLLDLHDNLLAGQAGRRVNGIGALCVLLLCATGAVIWWPGSRKWRRSLTVDVRSSSQRLIWTVHSALGFWFFAFILLFALTGTYLAFPDAYAAAFDLIQPFDPRSPVERTVDRVQFWLAYLHFGRFGGRIPGCGRDLCDAITKATWAVAGLVPPAMFITGATMWWKRVVRPAITSRQ